MRNRLKICVAIIAIIALAVLVVRAWRAQNGAGTTCWCAIDNRSGSNYIQIELRNQDPVEPIFSGHLFCYFGEDPKVDSLVAITKGAQGYGDMLETEKVFSMEGSRSFTVLFKNYVLIPISGRHRLFPFDSANFDTELDLRSDAAVSSFSVINRVDGFVLDCSAVSASSPSNGKIKLRFKLSRNPLVQLSAIVIAAASIAFAVLILRSKSIEGLSSSAASSFFSMWSVRSILASQIHVFPTLLDLTMLTASMILLVCVFWRMLMGISSRDQRDQSPH